jgi:uncharacterized protein (DUF488 family)
MIEDDERGDRPTIWTIGHGTRSMAELAGLLHAAGIEKLVDVRRFPGSHRNPQFSRDRLAMELPAAGIHYDWRGDELGGRRSLAPGNLNTSWTNRAFRAYAGHMESVEFRTGLALLEAETAAGRRQALMCAETLWWRCHRRLIADALVLDGFEVRHLIDHMPGQPHRLHPGVRRDEAGVVVYDSVVLDPYSVGLPPGGTSGLDPEESRAGASRD